MYNALYMPERSNHIIDQGQDTPLTPTDISSTLRQLIDGTRAQVDGKRGRPAFRLERVHELVESGRTEFTLSDLSELFDTTNPRKTAASIMSTLKDALEESDMDIRLESDTVYRFKPSLRD